MKRLNVVLTLLMTLSFISFATNCSNKDPEQVDAKIVIAQQEDGISFSKTGGTKDLNIQTNVTLDVKSNDESWCRVAPASSSSTVTLKYTVTVDANPTTEDRSTTITVKGGSVTETVQVTQTAGDGLIIAQTTFNDIPGAGADIEIKLTTNGDVTATCNVSWITQSAALRSMSERTVNFKVSSNYGDPREGTITFSLGSLTETVTIKQLAGEISNIGMNSDAMTLAKKMYAGWNIGNTLEAIGGETAWGNPKISENYVKKIKELGFNAIRIPCSWDQYIENTTTYKIKDSWLDRVNEVVGYCVNNDMYVIVNIHWDGGWLENNCTPDKQVANNKKQQALWTQIANKLNHYDEHLLFAGTNEPNADDATKMAVLKTYLQTFVDAVRATGGNNAVRNLIVQGTNTNIGLTTTLFGNMPNDVVENRLMLEVHNYDPWTFCGMDKDESWGKMAYYWGAYEIPGSDRNSTYFEEDEMKATFNQMTTNFVNKGIPVILGECGAITFHTGIPNLEAHILSRKLYDKTMIREAKNHGLVPFYWETGGVIDRNTGAIKESYDYDGIMEGAAEGKYPF